MPKYSCLVVIEITANNRTEAVDRLAYRRGVVEVARVTEVKNDA